MGRAVTVAIKVKKTFYEFLDSDELPAAESGMRRSNSAPSDLTPSVQNSAFSRWDTIEVDNDISDKVKHITDRECETTIKHPRYAVNRNTNTTVTIVDSADAYDFIFDTAVPDGANAWPESGKTTVMLKCVDKTEKLPKKMKYTRNMMKDLLDRHGMLEQVDMLYLPVRQSAGVNTGENIGLIFINFKSVGAADFFKSYGYQQLQLSADTSCNWIACDADIQGFEANKQKYMKRKFESEEYKPLFFQDGVWAPLGKTGPLSQTVKRHGAQCSSHR